MPFRLDFDELEERYPEIEDQRFWGFKQLSLSNGTLDPSYLREKVATDLFSDGGLQTLEKLGDALRRSAACHVLARTSYLPVSQAFQMAIAQGRDS